MKDRNSNCVARPYFSRIIVHCDSIGGVSLSGGCGERASQQSGLREARSGQWCKGMTRSSKVVLATKSSRLRWLILAVIVVSAFSLDYFLQRDISNKVRAAWHDACVQSLSDRLCEDRIKSHHPECFKLAYTSMIFTLGRSRWESFELINYEACMNRDETLVVEPEQAEHLKSI
jgi:hypothetical protein